MTEQRMTKLPHGITNLPNAIEKIEPEKESAPPIPQFSSIFSSIFKAQAKDTFQGQPLHVMAMERWAGVNTPPKDVKRSDRNQTGGKPLPMKTECNSSEVQIYSVMVDDNFNHKDIDHRYCLGQYQAIEDAIAAAKLVVDRYLDSEMEPGMTAAKLLDRYRNYGESPFITPPLEDSCVDFSAWNYAAQRCKEICDGASGLNLGVHANEDHEDRSF